MDWNSVKKTLPTGYSYNEVDKPYNGTRKQSDLILRVAELSSSEAAILWLKALADSHGVEWRKSGTMYHNPRPPAIFKTRRRCHHNTRSLSRTADFRPSSKNTKCPMLIKLSVVKSKTSAFGEVELYSYHNHTINIPASLSKRDVSDETRQRLISLFEQGYTAAGSLRILKFDLQSSSFDYSRIASDRSKVPDLNYVDTLFRHTKEQAYGKGDESIDAVQTNANGCESHSEESPTDQLIQLLSEKLQQHGSDVYVQSGVNKMMSDLGRITTASQLASFLHGSRSNRLSRGQIRVQPGAVSRRRPTLGRGSKPAPAGRPPNMR